RRGSEPAAEPHLHPGTRRSPAVATLFRRMIPDQLELLEQAISLRDAAEVKRLAHKLKGSCLALGARQMAALCAQLEPLPTDAQVRLVALRHEHQAVLEALASEGNS